MTPQIKTSYTVTLTANASQKIFSLIEEEANFNLKLRIYISGGGCSGFQYNFTFDEEVNEDDQVIAGEKGVYLLIDPMSFQYLSGAVIDYKEDIQGSQFIIKNPNATGSCGCGNSFDVA